MSCFQDIYFIDIVYYYIGYDDVEDVLFDCCDFFGV